MIIGTAIYKSIKKHKQHKEEKAHQHEHKHEDEFRHQHGPGQGRDNQRPQQYDQVTETQQHTGYSQSSQDYNTYPQQSVTFEAASSHGDRDANAQQERHYSYPSREALYSPSNTGADMPAVGFDSGNRRTERPPKTATYYPRQSESDLTGAEYVAGLRNSAADRKRSD